MDFGYKKANNAAFFEDLEKSDKFNIGNLQNYIPLYDNFFQLNEGNYNNINLNNTSYLHTIHNRVSHNIYNCSISDNSNNITNKEVFIKFSPLISPLKYLLGKLENDDITKLPQLTNNECHEKMLDRNNSAYTDGFFTYLSNILLKKHGFLHGLEYYGSYLGIQSDFKFDVIDDIEELCMSKYFNKYNDILFSLDDVSLNDIMDNNSHNFRDRLSLQSSIDNISIASIEDLNDTDTTSLNDSYNYSESANENLEIIDINETESESECSNLQNIVNKSFTNSSSSGSTCSSRTSNTSNESMEDEDEDEDEEEDEDTCSTCSSDDALYATIKNFPVQIISMEKCQNTLDYYMMNGGIEENEWKAILMQVIMNLITYQKVFDFTHNDLHTNNIMCIPTEKQYLYYCYNNTYYKVPTYGKIIKIIDFGRAIYKFRGKLICSDCFKHNEDAATQYNFEPYYNDKKPQLEPNPSFDLCRLGCAFFDFFLDDDDDFNDYDKLDELSQLVVDWCTDDNKKNILYKNNGCERYPNFKLYKMIARTAHNGLPHKQLEKPIFESFKTSRKHIKKTTHIMNIDKMPVLI